MVSRKFEEMNSNIFYHNLEPNDPHSLENSVTGELNYFRKYLYTSIESLDVEKYGIEWEKDERIAYKLSPLQRIKIQKPKNRILVNINPDEFNPRKPLMNSDEEPVEYSGYEKTDKGIIFTLSDKVELSEGNVIYYGRTQVSWALISTGFTKKITHLEDNQKNNYYPENLQTFSNQIIIDIKQSIPEGTQLYIDGLKIEYEEIIPLKNLRGLTDKKGKLEYSYTHNFQIQTSREINGVLKDEDDRTINYKLIPNKNTGNEDWVILKEPNEIYANAEDSTGSRLDVFFQMLAGSSDLVVWEKPDINHRKQEFIIKVKKIEEEKSRVLLDRLPESKKIYPPKNTYQLEKQKDAVETLINRPSPSHRNILKLFEPVEKTYWEIPASDFSESNIKWEFLTDITREGTDEQRRFVLKAMNSPDFIILEGPPGSGKTTAISELIYQLLIRKKRVLLAASTHVAIDNILEKLQEKYGGEKNLKQKGIVPLRIGREESISEGLQDYQIANRTKQFEDILTKEEWFANSKEDEKKGYLDEMVIWSSNLVCGTTIGILQYPHFKNKKFSYIVPEFDYLIIDEASKTTFQEFLVPAIHAKKWAIVGDVRQLSPTVDTLNVQLNYEGVLKDEAEKKALLIYLKLIFDRFDRRRLHEPPPPDFIYVDEGSVIHKLPEIISEKLSSEIIKEADKGNPDNFLGNLKIVFITNNIKDYKNENIELISSRSLESKQFELFNKNLIFIDKQIYDMNQNMLPTTHIVLNSRNSPEGDLFAFRHRYWIEWKKARDNGKKAYEYRLPKGKRTDQPEEITEDIMGALSKDWAHELAWRQVRVYELRSASGALEGEFSSSYYVKSLHALMPADEEKHRETWNQIDTISRVVFPSVLTSIQEGVTRFNRCDDKKTVMSNGLPQAVKEQRYEKLSYQHRMHPEISLIPRELFYKNQALKDVRSVKDIKDGGEGCREWKNKPCSRYDGRTYWKDVSDAQVSRNINEKEIKVIFDELDVFIEWLKQTNYGGRGSPSGWNIIILSFYEAQRKEIKWQIGKRYPEKNNASHRTRFKIKGVNVLNYTVDKVQGREGDVVFLSMVQNHRVGFMDNPNRLNVAITRARYQMVIVGDRNYFLEQKNSSELRQLAEKAYPVNKMIRIRKEERNRLNEKIKEAEKLKNLRNEFNQKVAESKSMRDKLNEEAKNACDYEERQELHDKATSYHEKVKEYGDRAQEFHEKLIRIFKEIDSIKKQD